MTADRELRGIIAKGSKTFALASLLLSRSQSRSVYRLYHWCRQCDDWIDSEPKSELRAARVEQLKRWTALASEDPNAELPDAFRDLAQVLRDHSIPARYAHDMISGFEFDSHPAVNVADAEALRTYCYQVAGTVGLMMAHVLGVSRLRALESAEALGAAMQMSNIIRDWAEDELNQRVYLPRTWLDSEGRWRAIIRVHAWAESEYIKGLRGVSALPLRAAWAVTVAAFLYRAISRKAILLGRPTEKRIVIGPFEKTRLFVLATFWLIPRMVERMTSNRDPVSLAGIIHTPLFDHNSGTGSIRLRAESHDHISNMREPISPS